jgi:mannose-6-phosphate isomerase-like protein (cupin superfamily)
MKVVNGIQMKRFAAEKMQKCNLFETDRFFFDVYCFEPGQNQKVHAHDGCDKVYYVLEGRGTFQIGDEKRELGPNDSTIAESGVPHGVENTGAERLVVLTMMTKHDHKH